MKNETSGKAKASNYISKHVTGTIAGANAGDPKKKMIQSFLDATRNLNQAARQAQLELGVERAADIIQSMQSPVLEQLCNSAVEELAADMDSLVRVEMNKKRRASQK